jgi:hypothetical protein
MDRHCPGGSQVSQPRVVRQSTDIVLKLIAAALGGDLFARFGVPLPPIVDALPTELPQLEVRTQQTDQLFRLADDSILHLEFQTTLRRGDLLRFAAYSLDVCQRYGQPVWTVVLYGAGIRSAPDTWQSGSHTFRVQNILVGQEDGDAVLRRLHEKAARGEPFTPTDRVDLILSPLMRQSRPVQDVLREAAPLTQRLPAAQQEPTVGALLGLAYHYVDENVVKAILEELSMANPLQELIDEREARGEIRGKRQAVRTFLHARFGALPEAVEQRIAAADADQLDTLVSRAAIVASPDEL